MKYIILVLTLLVTSITSFSQGEVDLLILNKKYQEAIQLINQKLETEVNVDLYFKKGLIYSNLQDYQNALTTFSTALVLQPENVEVIIEMAENLAVLGNQADAESYYLKAIELNPDNLTIKAKLGRVYINQKKIKLAYAVFSDIYSIDSTNVFWNKQYAYCCFQRGFSDKAIHIYRKVLDANPRDHSTYINLIRAYNWKSDGDSILAVIDNGFKQFHENDELFLERANYYLKLRNYNKARSDYDDYFIAGGDSIYDILLNQAICTYFSNDENVALTILSELFRNNPNDPFVQYYMALCYKKMNNFADAAKYMQWAIDVSYPEYLPKFYHHLGQIFNADRKFAESLKALQKANELDANDPEILFEIAITYEEYNRNITLALNYYELYLKEVGEYGKNVNYALNRITRIKEELFFEE